MFPVEDSILALQHGPVKDARFIFGLGNLAEPIAITGYFRVDRRIFSPEVCT